MILLIIAISVVLVFAVVCCLIVSEKEGERKEREERINQILNDISKDK